MADLHRLNRRVFLRETGRQSFAVAVLGSGVLAACSSDGDVTISQPNTSPGDHVDFGWARVELGNVSAYLIQRRDELAIVDTGSRGSREQIESALAELGAGWNNVDHVIVTHLHGDHVGGLPEVLEAAPEAIAYAGEADIPSISAPRELRPLNDGDEVFGMQVIATPGHTPGHISVLDPTEGFLVAGDALNEDSGMMLGPNPQYTPDMDLANASVKRLAERTYETVVFGHGDPFEGAASDAVVALAQTL
jgi:glyoxylase-like metal-dependent hydrolase (beta-lactamase superfamily II)